MKLLSTWNYVCAEHGRFTHTCEYGTDCTERARCPRCFEEGDIPEDEQ